ncbi:MAG: MBL fold metallo-hydrolase [Nanoarchaeota archaeon]|nr:MBL fold metallo-hydrolase [Nanoarchaeota archaeon]
MKITVLGSGTYVPQLDKFNSSYLVQIDNENLLFDFGRGAINQLLKKGIEYYDIDKIFITHTHADHCSELSSLLHIALAGPYQEKYRTKELVIYGPKGIKNTVNHLLEAFNLIKYKPVYEVKIVEIEAGEVIEENNWSIECFEAFHSESTICLSYRIESEDKIVSYSGDSGECEGLRECCKNSDLAIIDATFTRSNENERHLNGKMAGKIAKEVGVKMLVLTHTGISPEGKFNPLPDAKTFFEGPVVVAEDLIEFDL